MEVIYNNLKKLLTQVKKDRKASIKRLYQVEISLLKVHIDDNPFGERFTRADSEHKIKSNSAMQRLWKSYQLCGRYANPPMARFDRNFRNLQVVQGNSRIMAASVIGGLKSLPLTIVLPDEVTETQARQIVVDENTVRSAIGDYSKLMKIKQLRAQGLSLKQIAAERKMAYSTVAQFASIIKDKHLVNLVKTHTLGVGAACSLATSTSYHQCMNSSKGSVLEELFKELRRGHSTDHTEIRLKYSDIIPKSSPAIKKFCDFLLMLKPGITLDEALNKFKISIQKISFINFNKLNKASADQIDTGIQMLTSLRRQFNG